MTIPLSASSLPANGYPGAYDKGKEISGLEKLAQLAARLSSFMPAQAKKHTAGSRPEAGSWASPRAANQLAEAVKQVYRAGRRNLVAGNALSQRYRASRR
jgi:hypothetical protein